MGIIDDLLGGGQRRETFKDFVSRFEQGHPADGYSDKEVLERYDEVAHAVPADEYAQAAQEALARLSPEERAAFVKLLQERAQTRGVPMPSRINSDPIGLSGILAELHKIPGQLRNLLSDKRDKDPTTESERSASIFASPLAKAALAGITAIVASRVMRGSRAR
jgi:hypothetical protein